MTAHAMLGAADPVNDYCSTLISRRRNTDHHAAHLQINSASTGLPRDRVLRVKEAEVTSGTTLGNVPDVDASVDARAARVLPACIGLCIAMDAVPSHQAMGALSRQANGGCS